MASCALGLTGCSSGFPSIAGVWKASDGTPDKTISDDGNCTNLLYYRGTFTPVAAPGMCHLIGTSAGGGYIFQTVEGGRSAKYTAKFSDGGDTLRLTFDGKPLVTLKKTTSAH